uniref:Actin-related protein 2/3 complex subunit 5 n=1 Tax=Eubosmina coregoni TaxID=186181 RepID=A0A4Y7LLU0_9CRUS|nr:EOG090X0HLA [Eubosmina coregoni]
MFVRWRYWTAPGISLVNVSSPPASNSRTFQPSISVNRINYSFIQIHVSLFNVKGRETSRNRTIAIKSVLVYRNHGKNIEALKNCLSNAPLSSRNQVLKDAALAIVMRVLMSVKSSQMEEAVNVLDREQLDILMKYIYKGFETPSEGSSGHLLAWHEKVHAVAGVGCIVRVLTDRKRL